MSTKKNAGRKRGGKKKPETLDEALYGDYQENEILVDDPDSVLCKVRRDYLAKRGKPVPTGPDSDKPKKRLDWRGRDKAIHLVTDTLARMRRIPECPDPCEEQDRLDWHAYVGREIVEAILRSDKAAVLLFEGIAKLLKGRCVDENGDWTPVDEARVKAAVIVRRQRDERPGCHLPPMTLTEFSKRIGVSARTAARIAKDMGVMLVPGKEGRPNK